MLGQKKVKLTMRAICAGFLCAVCAMSGAQALASGTGVSELPAKTGKNRAGSKTFAAKASKTNREPKTARTLKVKKSAKSLSDGKKNTVAPGLSAIHDAELIAIYQHLLNGQINPALKQTEAMLAKAPNFRLGHLLHGDLLAIKAL